jgi:putative glutamine amidotransferase
VRRLIAVSATALPDSEGIRVRLARNYTRSLESAGLVPVIVPPLADPALAAEIIAGTAGLLLTGGEDVDPARYGAVAHPATQAPHVERDATELALLEAAHAAGRPVLGVCRGIQLINVAFGGTLVQDLPSERPSEVDHDPNAPAGTRCHGLLVEPGSRLATAIGGAGEIPVNSYHHQAVDHIAPGFRVTARATDGVIEAIESLAHDWWCLAVQWHPEDLTTDVQHWDRGIFRAFADVVRGTTAIALLVMLNACGFAGVGEPAPTVSKTTTATTGIDTPSSVAMTPATARVTLGDSVLLNATPIRATGSVGSFPATTWNYGPDSVGSISASTGASVWFRSRKVGVATVYALVSGVTGSAVVTVVP